MDEADDLQLARRAAQRARHDARDGRRPAHSGRQKVAKLLLRFFKTDETTQGWFTKAREGRW